MWRLSLSAVVFVVATIIGPYYAAASVTVADVTKTDITIENTTHNISMPVTVGAGDLLIATIEYGRLGGIAAPPVGTPAGWTKQAELLDPNSLESILAIFTKVALGNEDGTTVNFTSPGVSQAGAQVWRIAANKWYGDIIQGIATSTFATGLNPTSPGTANPPSLTPAWGSAENLWIAIAAPGNGEAISNYPTNYDDNHTVNIAVTSFTQAAASRLLTATTQDPGTFTFTNGAAENISWIAATIAVRPAPPGPTVMVRPPNNLGLIGYWSFNDGTGTFATDFSGNGNTGTLTFSASGGTALPTWVDGKFGRGLAFSNANKSYVDVAHNSAFDFTTTNFTVSFWVKGINFLDMPLISWRSATNGWNIDTDGDTAEFCGFAFGCHSSTTRALDDNKWHHVVFVRVGTGGTFYVDGVVDGPNPNNIGTNMSSTGSFATLVLGGYFDGNTFATASMDDIRIFNRSLSATEIGNMYKTGAAKFTTSAVELQRGSSLANGLVGHWTFDGPDVTDKIYDRSGTGNNTYFVNGATSSAKTIGKLGQALSFDGVDDNINVGNVGNVNTASLWVKPSSLTQSLLDSGGASNIDILSGTVRANSITSPTIYIDGALSSVFPDSSWHMVTVTTATAFNATGFNIGKISSSFFNGKIDDVRAYNRQLTAAEVKQLYLLGQGTIKQ